MVIGSVTLEDNIKGLRVIHIDQTEVNYDIMLNI